MGGDVPLLVSSDLPFSPGTWDKARAEIVHPGALQSTFFSRLATEGLTERWLSLVIDLSAMRNASDAYCPVIVVDDVDDAVIPDADAPEISMAAQFPAAGWPGISGQALDFRHQPRDEPVAQVLELLPGGRFNVNDVFSHAGARV